MCNLLLWGMENLQEMECMLQGITPLISSLMLSIYLVNKEPGT